MAKYVIHFKLDGNKQHPVFVEGPQPLEDPLTGVTKGFLKSGNHYFGISVDDAEYWLPPTVVKLATQQDAIAALVDPVLSIPTTETTGEGNDLVYTTTWTDRELTAQEVETIVADLFSKIA